MKGNSKKVTLLDKNNPYSSVNEEWIELEDLSQLKRPNSKANDQQRFSANEGPINYPQLGNYPQPIKPYAASSKLNESKDKKPQKPSVPAPNLQPSASMVDKPSVIRLNGSIFRHVGQDSVVLKKSKIPLMQVACDKCTLLQNVPGNTQVYICGSCNSMNECYPLYGIFVCGCCQCQVCYGFGTSEYIKCTRCGTINRVPTEPSKPNQLKEYPDQFPSQPKRQPAQEGLFERDWIDDREEENGRQGYR